MLPPLYEREDECSSSSIAAKIALAPRISGSNELTNDGFDLKSTRRPIQGSQIPDFLTKWEKRLEGDNSWTVPISEIELSGAGIFLPKIPIGIRGSRT